MRLKEYEEAEAECLTKDIGGALPYGNPEKIFATMIVWGCSAGLMDYNAQSGMVFVPQDSDSVEDTHI